MKRKAMVWALLVGFALAAPACGPAPIRPVTYPDPDVSCPGGLISWRLDIVDQRAEPEGSEKLIASLRDGIQGSFPGCRWSTTPSGQTAPAGEPTITITVFRLGVSEHDRYQYAAAEWNVTATSANGSALTQFDANEDESRPAYSGADEEALNEVFRRALQRTAKGLAQMQRLGSLRHPEGTFLAGARRASADANAKPTR
jgi:hypothetical protein